MHIALGSGRRESLRPRDFDAYFARAQRSLERFVGAPPATVARPCAACDMCRFRAPARAVARQGRPLLRRRHSPHPDRRTGGRGSRDARRPRRDPLSSKARRPEPRTLARLQDQAALQAATRSNGHIATRRLPVEEKRGFERLPRPSRLDLAIDLEGDPFWRADRELISCSDCSPVTVPTGTIAPNGRTTSRRSAGSWQP